MRLRYPLDKVKITQSFGDRPSVYQPYKGHTGIDLKTKWADTPDGERPVYAAAAGKVQVGYQGNYGAGRFVRIVHPDGSQTLYGHLSAYCVRGGEYVMQGQKIGISGNTGFSDAPHLHFGYRPPNFSINNGYGGYINPLLYMDTTISEPYFEQKIGQPIIAAYSQRENGLLPFASGDVFKMLYGGYDGVLVHKVVEWSKPLLSKQITCY